MYAIRYSDDRKGRQVVCFAYNIDELSLLTLCIKCTHVLWLLHKHRYLQNHFRDSFYIGYSEYRNSTATRLSLLLTPRLFVCVCIVDADYAGVLC